MIRKGFKPGAINCRTTSPKQGNNCQNPMQTMAPSNLLSLIQHPVSNVNENSDLNSTFFDSKALGITILNDLPQLEKKKKSTESLKPGRGSKKSKSKRKLTEEGPVAKAPKSKKKKLMGEIHKDGRLYKKKLKNPGASQVGKKEKVSSDAKEKKSKGLHHSKKNKGKLDGNVTVTVGESREMLGTKTKKAKKHKKKSDKKKKDKDKKNKKKKRSPFSRS
ncbi:LOW QUALITY PROTEIN: treacle protein-like [Antechinus flavipes]|uniref:LOW QUALITY PROTEIN: treacle protein-like n=1 Tax=Antechinus flavipes TaxID=38775 RepID=UPI0022364B8A|nr:LOW QUALITY PROTEIN: treacle protein-like [Antechinus flavipes]